MSTLSWHLPLAICMVPSDGSTYLMSAHKYGAKGTWRNLRDGLLGASHAGVAISSANGTPRRETCCSDNKTNSAKYPRKFWIDLNVTGT